MAIATACCKCEICDREFEKTAVKKNRREADEWEAWAEKHITVCPSCYGKQQQQKEKNAGLVAKIRFGNPYGNEEAVWVVLHGDTYSIKDKLKEIGAIWTDAYPDSDSAGGVLLSGLSTRRPMKRWAILLSDLDRLPDKVELLEDIGFSVELPNDDAVATYRIIRADVQKQKAAQRAEQEAAKEKKWLEQQKALDELGPKPSYSDEIRAFFPVGTTWNRKFYGKPGKYRVYISGQEVFITNDQKAEMEQTLNARDAWEEKKEAILKQ